MTPVTWGILGAAKIARQKVIPAMAGSQDIRILGLASRDEARARATADALGIPRAYGSYDALLADPEIEAVYNPLPNHLHVPLTLKALAAGKHVLCEKPLALTAAEAAALEAAQTASGRLVAEAFMIRHHPQWLRARDLVRSGALGDVRTLHVHFSYALADVSNIRNQPEMGGGGLYDIGCYAITAARYLFGAEPEKVIAHFDRDATGTDRLASGLAVFSGGRSLTFSCATLLTPGQRVEVHGTQARLVIPIPFNAPADAETRLLLDDGRDLAGGGLRTEIIPACDQYRLQGEAFGRALRGSEPLEFGLADAIAGMKVLDALFRSGDSGHWETP